MVVGSKDAGAADRDGCAVKLGGRVAERVDQAACDVDGGATGKLAGQLIIEAQLTAADHDAAVVQIETAISVAFAVALVLEPHQPGAHVQLRRKENRGV